VKTIYTLSVMCVYVCALQDAVISDLHMVCRGSREVLLKFLKSVIRSKFECNQKVSLEDIHS
jgi:hypothetical protein